MGFSLLIAIDVGYQERRLGRPARPRYLRTGEQALPFILGTFLLEPAARHPQGASQLGIIILALLLHF